VLPIDFSGGIALSLVMRPQKCSKTYQRTHT
jgi:hypothetical protein